MKILFSTKPDYAIGGGFTFARNIIKYLEKKGVAITYDVNDDYDIYFIIGPTTAQRDDVKKAISKGKKVVLRVDNIPEDYRNRGTAVSRLKDFSVLSDVVIYQSEWAKKYVMGLTERDGTVIYNGVDTDIFKNDTHKIKNTYLYIRSSTNESKRWQEAKYIYRKRWLNGKADNLTIIGNFADYVKQYGDDFFNKYKMGMFDEPYKYLGQIEDHFKIANIMKTHEYLIAPFYNDACSNTILEARACGMKIILGTAKRSGSNPELMRLENYDLDTMGDQYLGVFGMLTNESF